MLSRLGITLFFVIPRAPAFTFYVPQPFLVNNNTIAFSRTPTNFSFTGNLNLFGERAILAISTNSASRGDANTLCIADATSSYLPVHFSNIQATVYDLTTEKVVATGDYGNHIVSRKHNAPVVLPVEFSYSALNSSDPTCECHYVYLEQLGWASMMWLTQSREQYVQCVWTYMA